MTRSGGRQTKPPDTTPTSISCYYTIQTVSEAVHDNIEAIEAGYEFLLAYAAQGRETDEGPGGSEVRDTLTTMAGAAAAIGAMLADDNDPFAAVVVDDARKSGAAIALVLAQEAISSELVDNLNASIHLRALLTDLFLLSETLD